MTAMQPLSNFLSLADIDQAVQSKRLRDLQISNEEFKQRQAADAVGREQRLRNIMSQYTDPGAPAVPHQTDEEQFMGVPALQGNLASLARPASFDTKGMVGAAFNQGLGPEALKLEKEFASVEAQKTAISASKLKQAGDLADYKGRFVSAVKTREGYEDFLNGLDDEQRAKFPPPDQWNQEFGDRLSEQLRGPAITQKMWMDHYSRMARISAVSSRQGKVTKNDRIMVLAKKMANGTNTPEEKKEYELLTRIDPFWQLKSDIIGEIGKTQGRGLSDEEVFGKTE